MAATIVHSIGHQPINSASNCNFWLKWCGSACDATRSVQPKMPINHSLWQRISTSARQRPAQITCVQIHKWRRARERMVASGRAHRRTSNNKRNKIHSINKHTKSQTKTHGHRTRTHESANTNDDGRWAWNLVLPFNTTSVVLGAQSSAWIARLQFRMHFTRCVCYFIIVCFSACRLSVCVWVYELCFLFVFLVYRFDFWNCNFLVRLHSAFNVQTRSSSYVSVCSVCLMRKHRCVFSKQRYEIRQDSLHCEMWMWMCFRFFFFFSFFFFYGSNKR